MAIFFVHGVFAITGRGIIIAGQVQEGTISLGQTITIGGKEYTLKEIEIKHQPVPIAQSSQMVALVFDGLSDGNAIQAKQTLTIG